MGVTRVSEEESRAETRDTWHTSSKLLAEAQVGTQCPEVSVCRCRIKRTHFTQLSFALSIAYKG